MKSFLCAYRSSKTATLPLRATDSARRAMLESGPVPSKPGEYLCFFLVSSGCSLMCYFFLCNLFVSFFFVKYLSLKKCYLIKNLPKSTIIERNSLLGYFV